jgi:hypothetical protein
LLAGHHHRIETYRRDELDDRPDALYGPTRRRGHLDARVADLL